MGNTQYENFLLKEQCIGTITTFMEIHVSTGEILNKIVTKFQKN